MLTLMLHIFNSSCSVACYRVVAAAGGVQEFGGFVLKLFNLHTGVVLQAMAETGKQYAETTAADMSK